MTPEIALQTIRNLLNAANWLNYTQTVTQVTGIINEVGPNYQGNPYYSTLQQMRAVIGAQPVTMWNSGTVVQSLQTIVNSAPIGGLDSWGPGRGQRGWGRRSWRGLLGKITPSRR